MTDVLKVAKYILDKKGPMNTLKLQKLVYYCQAWSLVWDEHPLFDQPIQAWKNGPVVPQLYERHRGKSETSVKDFADIDYSDLQKEEIETIEAVLAFYGDRQPWELRDLTHEESPWLQARGRAGVEDGDSCMEVIRNDEMQEYYAAL